MKGKLGILLFISLFLGFVCGGAAIGTVFPSINRIAAPLVCQGRMEIEVREYSVRPGEHSTQNTIYCIDEASGDRREITLLAVVVSCLIFSAIIFLLFAAYMLFRRLTGKPSEEPPAAAPLPAPPPEPQPSMKAEFPVEDPAVSLKKLKELQEAGLITAQEYEAKKAEILSRM